MEKMKESYIHCVLLLLLLHLLQLSGGEVNSITAYFIGIQGLNLPDYMERIAVNDVTMFYYDSSMKDEVSCPDWLNTSSGKQHWMDINLISLHNKHSMATALKSAILQFNQTASSSDVNIYQGYGRCSVYPNGTLKALLTHAFNGKDFLTFDVDRKSYIASVPQAVIYKRQREANPVWLEIMASFYKKTCFERLKMFLQHASVHITKKVPEVHLFKSFKSGSSVLACHVTGFYPKEVQVEWIGAGLQPVDGEVIEVLPNGDGTYQTRRSVIRPEENPEKHSYSCVVQHSSIAGNITKTWVAEEHSLLAVWISLVCILVIIGTGLVLRKFCRCGQREQILVLMNCFSDCCSSVILQTLGFEMILN
ncbi:class I histocompatibility antigen, F10 alpha chain-like [Astyanax mexicanus]|uniref:Class I histocompatibility antigen, F10 alpha chain-like n=1 Tax=Astyanax mexicanus TaxID=7994 RepID=A0A8T2MDG2_ASTMX|nr:class I histocompatibility antigen, F10 alpha chain-like [Astyanax mexicanus]